MELFEFLAIGNRKFSCKGLADGGYHDRNIW
jgi:hypothetical protein